MTKNGLVALDTHPETEEVSEKVVCPCSMAVICPLLLMLAMAGLELDHVPTSLVVKVDDSPTHKTLSPAMAMMGLAKMVMLSDGKDLQDVAARVNTKLALPGPMVDTTPVGEMEATVALLLVQVPPELGLSNEFSPIHKTSSPKS